MENTILDNLPPKAQVWESHQVSLLRRFMTRLIDLIVIYYLTLFLLTIIHAAEIRLLMREEIVARYLVLSIGAFIYYLVAEFLFGRTIGKIWMGTKVISLRGRPLQFGWVFIRTLCRFIPFEALSFFAQVQGLHDRLSKTAVVSTTYKAKFGSDD
jgi:uncharacterized RDD family membrane protein YckC